MNRSNNSGNLNSPLFEGKAITPDGYAYDPLVMQERYANEVLDLDIPTQEVKVHIHRGAAGFVNASVMGPPPGMSREEHEKLISTGDADAYHVVNESGWKKNMILDTGLDKVASMPWAQTFQFCVAGTTRDVTAVAASETRLKQYHSINSFWLTGEPHTGTQIQGNVVQLRRTFDFYKVFCPTIITEIGMKESPASRTLFSRILLDPPQQLHAGQFLRIEYLLQVVMSPWSDELRAARYGNIYNNNGVHEIRDFADGSPYVGNLSSWGIAATGTAASPTTVPIISGWNTSQDDLHGLQLVGMAGIDPQDGMVKPIDKSGFCNEPFAPGTCSFGPGYGYCNRWRNGGAVTYHKNSGEGITIQTSLPYLANGVTSPYLNVGPLYDYVDEHWDPEFNTYIPDPTTQAKVYRNPHEWLNYTFSINNDGRVDRDGHSTAGALYFRTDNESDFVTADYNAVIATDYRKYLYYNYWAPGILENIGAHHGYQGNPSTSSVGDTSNSYDPVYVVDKENDDRIFYWKTLYYKKSQPFNVKCGVTGPGTGPFAPEKTYYITDYLPAIAHKYDCPAGTGPCQLDNHLIIALAGAGRLPGQASFEPNIGAGPYWMGGTDLTVIPPAPMVPSTGAETGRGYESVYQSVYGMTGKSSFDNMTHLWDPVVKFDYGRGVNPSEIFTHYTNRTWDECRSAYIDNCKRWDFTENCGCLTPCPKYAPNPAAPVVCNNIEVCLNVGIDPDPCSWDSCLYAQPNEGKVDSGINQFNHIFAWNGDPRVAWYHAHHKAFYDPALGIPAINKFQCGSARVYLSGMYMTFCPGTKTFAGPGQTSVLPSNWNAATYVNNPTAYDSKSHVPYVLGLSGELIPVPEPNPKAASIAFSLAPGTDNSYGHWPDWNREIPYKDDFVAGASCFLSTMSAPPTAGYGATTRWTSPSASEWDGWDATLGLTISSANFDSILFEGKNPEYNALVSEVSATTLNRWDGTLSGHTGWAHDRARGPYNDTVQTTGITAVELPLRLEPYSPGSLRRVKYAVFEPSLANAAWMSLGVGPTTKSIVNNFDTPGGGYGAMHEAATYPGYVYTFSGARDTNTNAITGNVKLDTHQLKLSFIYTWQRLTSYGQVP